MHSFLESTQSLQGILPLFADAAIKGAVLVLIAAIAVYGLRNRSASSRHAVWSAAVIGHLAIPLFMLILPAWKIPFLPATPWTMSSPSQETIVNPGTVSPVVINNSVNDGVSAPTDHRSTTQPATQPATQLAARTSLPSELRAAGSSAAVSRPMSTVAVIALVHEMAHVKRFDALTQLLAQLAVALFWFDPLVWIAAHQMRVEREHACDDYVLRDGTTPSLYAGELLEMVRNIGTPRHDNAAPAFAALAMARRSEFEGRMLAILDPRLDRNTLNRRGAFMTAGIVALLTIPLAALRPYQQSTTPTKPDEFPSSFKVTISDGKGTITPVAQGTTGAAAGAGAGAGAASGAMQRSAQAAQGGTQTRWSCEKYPVGTELHGSSTHISQHTDIDGDRLDLLFSDAGHCTEAAVIGKIVFSPDERRIAQLAPGGFARFRERTSSFDRAVSVTTVGDGSLSYAALVDGHSVPFDGGMQSWLSELLPIVLREIPVNVPERVARFRAQGGVPAVLQEIARIRSSSAKRAHYEELIKNGPTLSDADVVAITRQVGRDLTSSGDLSSVLQLLPRKAMQSPAARQGVADALSHISSSGDKANTLQVLAPNADAELLVLLAQAAEQLPSSGDKANFLIATAAQYLTPNNPGLRNAYFRAASTVQSSGDLANVLITAMPYSHATPQVAFQVIEISNKLASSGDAANVLIDLVSQRVLQPGDVRATIAAIERTLTMASSGDRANVLISIAGANLLTTREAKDAFTKAALALPSDGDRANVLAAAARGQ